MSEYITTPDGRRWFPESPAPERPGKEVVFGCTCGSGRAHLCGTLHVIPIKIDGVKCVDLTTQGLGGVVLSGNQRAKLARILLDPDWFGA